MSVQSILKNLSSAISWHLQALSSKGRVTFQTVAVHLIKSSRHLERWYKKMTIFFSIVISVQVIQIYSWKQFGFWLLGITAGIFFLTTSLWVSSVIQRWTETKEESSTTSSPS